jgi:hypothetical protein
VISNQPSSSPTGSAPVKLEAAQGHPLFWGRLLLGLILSQGLYYGLRQLGLAWLARGGEGADFFQTEKGTLVLTGGQLFALLIGGVVGASGLPRGVLFGGLLGCLNSAIFIGTAWWRRSDLDQSLLVNGPVLHVLIGAIGGLLGRLIWKPLPPLPRYDTPGSSTAVKVKVMPELDELGPLIWSRILTGAVFAFVGTVFAQDLRSAMGRYALTNSRIFDQFVNWQIGALIVLAGGAVAGANTRRGFMHGLIVGGLACVGLVVTQYTKNILHFAAHEFWIDQLNVKQVGNGVELQMVLFAILHTLFLTLLGGWLGSQLLPPTLKKGPTPMARV